MPRQTAPRPTSTPAASRALRPAIRLAAATTAALLAFGTPAMASAADAPTPAPTASATPATVAPATATPAPEAPATQAPATQAPAPEASATEAQRKPAPNSAPVAHDDSFTVVSGHLLSVKWSTVLANDSDPDGDTFAPASAKEPLHGVIDYAGLLPGATISYTSTPGFTGTETLAYTVRDSKGTASAAASITITVTPNHSPIGVKDTYSVQSGAKLTAKSPGVRSNDTDADGDIAKSTIAITAPPLHGTVTLPSPAGGFNYTSTPGFVGQDVFYYRISDGFGGQSAVTPVLVTVTTANFSVAPAPVIKGTAKVGEGLIATVGSWTPTPTTYTYQWKRDGVKIPGATANNYTLTAADAGKAITVSGTGSTASIAPFITDSLPTAKVALGSFSWSTIEFHGTTIVGNTLTSTVLPWSPGPVALSLQWTRDNVAIPGATGSSYTLTNADWKKSIRLTVTGSRAGYTTATHETAGSTVLRGFTSAPRPVVTGTLKVGKTVTATTAGWSPQPTSFTYEWRRDNYPIAGATGKTYTIRAADAGHALSVYVTPKKTGYYGYGAIIDSEFVYPTK